MLVDVKLLTLLCVLKEGSYTAAAEALALSQPAVSYHIHQLEQEFHIKIFYRNHVGVITVPRHVTRRVHKPAHKNKQFLPFVVFFVFRHKLI